MVRLPIFDILPNHSLPPLECGFGVNPNHAARSRAVLKPVASGKVAARTLEVIGPMPGQSPGKPSPGSFSGPGSYLQAARDSISF